MRIYSKNRHTPHTKTPWHKFNLFFDSVCVVFAVILFILFITGKLTVITGILTNTSFNPNDTTAQDNSILKNYFINDYASSITNEEAHPFRPSTPKLDYTYTGQLNNEKRYLSIGFDDFRGSDFSMIIPLFEKYGFRATFNQIMWFDTLSDTEKAQIDSVLFGGHELGNHTFGHQVYIYSDPLCNGQDPENPDGDQVPYPTNEQIREDRGDGKNVFGLSLTDTTSSLIYFSDFDVPFKDLSDEQCQRIRDYFSIIKDPWACSLYDTLSNRYLGTSGQSLGSWSDEEGCYTSGIFTGCQTSQNHEIWERILSVTSMYLKEQYGLNDNLKTWSYPGDKCSPFQFESNGEKFYDENCTVHANYLAKITSSLTGEKRSWTDVLRNFGYTISHDYLYPSRSDGQTEVMMSKQFIYNASMSRKDALPYPTNASIYYTDAGALYTEDFFTNASKSKAAQMYDHGGEFYTFIEAIRHDTSNGMVHGEVIDSIDSQTERTFMEEILRYCKETGIEVITKAEAYDLCFNHKLYQGNLIYNPKFRNTAKEFMPDAEKIPRNPDGYQNDCYVTYDENFVPTLNIPSTNSVEYLHYGIPTGSLRYSLEAMGLGEITIYAIQNKDSTDLVHDKLIQIGQLQIDNTTSFVPYSLDFFIKDYPLTAYEQLCEGYGDKIMGIKIVYSPGISIKKLNLTLQ